MNQLMIARSRKHDTRDGWYTFTPTQAAQLLEVGKKNRPLTESRAQQIARDIKEGVWKPNGESFIFDEENKPIDCQHRLRACVIANMPIEGYCVFGIPSEYFVTLDQGKQRGGSDLAALAGFKHAALTAATVRQVMAYRAKTIGKRAWLPVTQAALNDFMSKHKEALVEAVTLVAKHRAGFARMVPLSQVAFLAYIAGPSNRLEVFVEKLSSGAGLPAGDPIMVFRNRMISLIGEKNRLTQGQQLAMLVKTWNASVARKSVKLIKWAVDIENFPVIEVAS
jgi:hypothetical protein